MRRLIYIPIIHTDSDMGSLAAALEQQTAAQCGEQRWGSHKVTAAEFWQMVSDYLETLDARSLKVYQDGFVTKGDLSQRIIEEGVKKSSQNYAIILKLFNRGAEIVSTEDVALLREEYGYISRIIKARTPSQRKVASKEYEARKAQLVLDRDHFIARTINETLGEGEVGLLFLGAYHDIVPYLATDIVIVPLKEREKVKAYFTELMSGGDEKNFERLTSYLTSAIASGIS